MAEMSIVAVDNDDDDDGTVSMAGAGAGPAARLGAAGSAKTSTVFHVALNPDAVRSDQGETVSLHGNIPELGSWDGIGLPMRSSQTDPRVWEVDVVLPFGRTAVNLRGLFQCRYSITRADGVQLMEGGVARPHRRMAPHFYGAFGSFDDPDNQRPSEGDKVRLTAKRSGYSVLAQYEVGEIVQDDKSVHLPFKIKNSQDQVGWFNLNEVELADPRPPPVEEEIPRPSPSVPGDEVVNLFFGSKFFEMQTGAISAGEFMEHFSSIKDGVTKFTRSDAEDIFDRMIDTAGPDMHTPCLLALLAIIGTNGLSSDEREFVQHRGGAWNSSYSTGSGFNTTQGGGYWRDAPMPKARVWCHYVIAELKVVDLLPIDFAEILGTVAAVKECIVGLEEAVERVAHEKDWSWLRIVPILRKCQASPSVSACGEDRTTFWAAADEVINQARAERDAASQLYAAAKDETQSEKIREFQTEQARFHGRLSTQWLRAVVQFSPNIVEMGHVLRNPVVKAALDAVEPAILEKISEYDFRTSREVIDLVEVAKGNEQLTKYGLLLSAALLGNKEADLFSGQVIEFIQVVTSVKKGTEDPNEKKHDQVMSLIDSAKGWIERKHGDAPLRYSSTKNVGGKWTTVPPSDQEIHRDRVNALRDAMTDIDGLLQIQCLQTASHARSLVFALARCHMFKGAAGAVLRGICAVAADRGGKFGVASALLEDSLTEKAERLAAQIVEQAQTNGPIDRLIRDVSNTLSRKASLCPRLLATVAIAMSDPTSKKAGAAPSLTSVIRRHEQWLSILECCGSADKWPGLPPVGELCTKVATLLRQVAVKVADSSVDLAAMHAIRQNSEAFITMCQHLDIPIDSQTVKDHDAKLKQFEELLKQTSSFVNFFCSCGVKIDADVLRATVNKITVDFKKMPFAAIGTVFENVQCTEHIPWLFGLQSSNLFLTAWRAAGDRVCLQLKREAGNAAEHDVEHVMHHFDAAIAADRQAGVAPFGGVDVVVGTRVMNLRPREHVGAFEEGEVISVIPSDDGQTTFGVQWTECGRCDPVAAADADTTFTAFQMMHRMLRALAVGRDVSPEEQDHAIEAVLSGKEAGPAAGSPVRGNPNSSMNDTEFDDIVLTQAQVAELLIPTVRREWAELYRSVKEKTIGTVKLQRSLATLGNRQTRAAEMKMLMATGEGAVFRGGVPDAALAEWVHDVLSSVEDFVLSQKLREWIPSLLHVRTLMAKLCQLAAEDDRLVVRLESFHTTLEEAWASQCLGTLSALVDPVRHVFEGFNPAHLDFFAKLGDNDDLVLWLLEHGNTDSFNSLLQVCRPRTDDPRLLKAIASLVQVRTLLINFLYVEGPPGLAPYRSLQDLVYAVKSVDMANGSTTTHLVSVQLSFAGLQDLFEKETRSPGIKACHELDEIRRGGTFVLSACGDKDLVLQLELPVVASGAAAGTPPTTDGDTAAAPSLQDGDQTASASGAVRVEPFEYVIDLRSKLIMVEIPAELELEIPNLRETIDAFSEQLQVISEMRDALFELYTGGHFRFQARYEERHRFDPSGLAALQESLASLRQHIKTWNFVQKAARDQFYYMNYFTMREVLQMTVLLDSASALQIAQYESPAEFHGSMMRNLGRADPSESCDIVSKPTWCQIKPADPDWDPAVDGQPWDGQDDDLTIGEEDVTNFQQICGASEDEARAFLACHGDLDKAVSAFVEVPDDSTFRTATPAAAGPIAPDQLAAVMGFCSTDADTARAFMERYHNVDAAVSAFMDSGGILADNAAPASYGSPGKRDDGASLRARLAASSIVMDRIYKVALEFESMLHLVSSFVELPSAIDAMLKWATSIGPSRAGDGGGDRASVLLRIAASDPEELLTAVGTLLENLFGSTDKASGAPTRKVAPPGQWAKHRSDLVGVLTKSGEDETPPPIWVTCAESANRVIDVVLSVFVRRARLPEPGEIVFCTSETTLEDVEILFRRWIQAKQNGRSDQLYVLADIHSLAYTKQCAVVDMLQEMLAAHGHRHASNLLVVSGRKRQVILNSLSQNALECPPLDEKALRAACTQAFKVHCGATTAVTSRVNGSGKTSYIMQYTAERQRFAGPNEKVQLYRRLPVREATTASSLLTVLAELPPLEDHIVHVDIGHIIPACANTVLFELLLVGVIRDTASCRVYHRRRGDVFFLEIPNSIGDKTATALRISSFLPQHEVHVSPESLRFHRARFCNPEGTLVEVVDNESIVYVCKFLRALRNKVFDVNSNTYNLMFQPYPTDEQAAKIEELCNTFTQLGMPIDRAVAQAWLQKCDWEVYVALNCVMDGQEAPPPSVGDGPISASECFELLRLYSALDDDDVPNYAMLATFASFMYPQLRRVTEWPLISVAALEQYTHNMFKQSFIKMLIASARDFTGRSVPQANQLRSSTNETGDDETVRTISGGRGALGRTLSGKATVANDDDGAAHDLENGAFDGGEVPIRVLTREDANEMAARFESMLSWENSDHPVAVWNVPAHGTGVDGVNILTLNEHFADEFMNRDLRHHLRGDGIDLNRDWAKLTNQEGIDILRHAMGVPFQPCTLTHGYVLTVDNLLKMLSIGLRLKYQMPVVIMGETGCGKSSLMRSMCTILSWRLYTLNIHGGMQDKDIISWMTDVLRKVAAAPPLNAYGQPLMHVVFLDEVNTCNCMGLFNEMTCDGTMDGTPIPEGVRIVSACNPYRLRRTGRVAGTETGLVFDHHDNVADENVGSGIKDPLADLVYRVHPLPESMTDYVFDFGALSKATEELYIRAMIKSVLQLYLSEEATVEELSQDDQIVAQAQRMGIEIPEGMSREQKVQAVRLKMREMIVTEAHRRAGAPVAEGDAAAFEAANLQNMQQAQAQANPNEDGDTDEEDEDDEGDHLDEPLAPVLNDPREMLAGLLGMPGMPGMQGEGGEPNAGQEQQAAVGMAQQQIMAEMRATADMGEDGLGLGGYQAKSRFGEFVDTFTGLVCAAQEFVREFHGGERSSASLRDVARCIKVYRWFGEHISDKDGQKEGFSRIDFFSVVPQARQAVRDALICSLAYCYHSRLPREQRGLLRVHLTETWNSMQVPSTYNNWGWYVPGKECCAWLKLTPRTFQKVTEDVQRSFVEQMKFPSGIALNEALCENVFMMLVSVLNQIPIFIIGKPGTSKSLAMELVQTNLQGKASSNDFLRSLPAVQKFSYQCSPLSTSGGIEQAFESARRYKMEAPNTIVVVLLDEVGLAEQSPHLPLKVLHKTLDEARENESVVGISNWALDPAKMNRAVHLYRPAPTVEDLALTAEGMVQRAELKGYLQAIAKAFSQVYDTQTLPDFWGMREFYSTVRAVNKALTDHETLSPALFVNAILRNYGGRPSELENVINSFCQTLAFRQEEIDRASVVDLVRQNITEPDARHLMLLTKNNVALGMLFDHTILSHENATVIFGSDFPLDKTDLQICLNLQRVKHCMANGVTLVLVHCEALYESMYDLLNQHYTEAGGQLWVRLAFGTHSRLCPIDPSFRVIVVVEAIDAYTKLAPPLLNRFEKQVVDQTMMLTDELRVFLKRLESFARVFASRGSDSGRFGERTSMRDLKTAICGFHSDMLVSLCHSVVRTAETKLQKDDILDWDELYQEAVRRLLLASTPEAACRILQNKAQHAFLRQTHQVDVPRVYFGEQRHSNLHAFASSAARVGDTPEPTKLSMFMTYAPLFLGAAQQVKQVGTWTNVDLTVLHDLDSERDMQHAVDQFFESAERGSVLLVQCDPRAASLRRIAHAQHICEKAADEFRTRNPDFVAPPPAVEPPIDVEASLGESGCVPSDGGAPPAGGSPADEGRAMTEKQKKLMEKDAALLEEKKGAVPPPRGLDIVFLVHLQRGSDAMFNINFGNRWQYAFIDSINQASSRGLPDVEDMMEVTLAQMVQSDSIDLAKVLETNFRFAMGRLVYMYERSNKDVRDQIGLILSFLHRGAFIGTVQQHMLVMIEAYSLTLNLSSIMDGGSNALVGTFQQALHRQFSDALSAMFSILLSHMDRNSGLELFSDLELQPLWLYLFRKSFKDMDILSLRRFETGTMNFSVEVKSDGYAKAPFKSHFPFSFFLNRILESMREAAETIRAKGDDAVDPTSKALQRQFDMFSIEHGLSKELSQDLLMRYMHDFSCMHLLNSKSIHKPIQTQLLWHVLQLHVPDVPVQTLSQVHGRFWDCERRMKLYCEILDAVPEAAAPLMAILDSTQAVDFVSRTHIESIADSVNVLVLESVLSCLDVGTESWAENQDYGTWCTQMDEAKAAVLSLLALVGKSVDPHHATVSALRLHWEKLALVDKFVRDIAVPLNVDPAISLELVSGFRSSELRSHAAFYALLRLLCLQVVMPSELGSADTLRRGAISLMQTYFFDICFSQIDVVTDTQLLRDFVLVIAGRDVEGLESISQQYDMILTSETAKVSLLSHITKLSDMVVREAAVKALKYELSASARHAKFLDNPLGVTFVAVEEQRWANSKKSTAELVKAVDMSRLSRESMLSCLKIEPRSFDAVDPDPAGVHKTVEAIALTRLAITQWASLIAEFVAPPDDVTVTSLDWDKVQKVTKQITPLLLRNASVPAKSTRSIRMFFLKVLERKRGLAFVRTVLQSAPINASPWLEQWRQDNEVGLVRFMGANKLPSYNPFKNEPLFDECVSAFASFLATGNLDTTVTACISTHKKHPRIKCALALALFHEVGLLSVLPDALSGETGHRIAALSAWLRDTPMLSFLQPRERQFILFCAGHFFRLPPHRGDRPGIETTWAFFQLDASSSPEKIVLIRSIVHMAARALASQPGDQLWFFNRCTFNTADLADTKLPTMADDALYMVQKALMEAGVDSGAKRWFTCPNGHPFAIGNCGGAIMESTCPECNAKIGGTGHKLKHGKALGDVTGGDADALFQASVLVDNSDPGYCLRAANKEDKNFAARKLTEKTLRLVRVLMHAALSLGYYLADEEWVTEMLAVVNPGYSSPEITADPGTLILGHLRHDLVLLKGTLDVTDEQLALLLHEVVNAADRESAMAAADAAAARVANERALEAMGQRLAATTMAADQLTAQRMQEEQDGSSEEQLADIDQQIREIRGQCDAIDAQLSTIRAVANASQRGVARHPSVAGQACVLGPGAESAICQPQSGRALGYGEVAMVVEHRSVRGKSFVLVQYGGPGQNVAPQDDDGEDEEHEHEHEVSSCWYEAKALQVERAVERLPDTLSKGSDREQWEAAFHLKVLDPLVDGGVALPEKLREIEESFTVSDDEGSSFKEELLERFSVASFAVEDRQESMAGLWMYKRPFSFEKFEAIFTNNEENAERYPVLSTFLRNQQEMLSLRHMPTFFRWLDLIMERFDMSIDHATARAITVRQAIEKAGSQHQTTWQAAFAKFEEVWNLSWHRIEAFGCEEVPKMYRKQSMSLDAPICFSLPAEDDEGMCPLHLAQYLVNQHNDFVQQVDQALLLRKQDLQRHSTREKEISSQFMTEAHVLNFDLEAEFVPFVLKQCVQQTESAEVVCDFATAEKFLVDRCFRNKPLVNLRLRGFKYADKVAAGRSLASKVEQEELGYEATRRIQAELEPWPQLVHRVLDMVDTCTNFLTSASFAMDASVGEIMLEQYLRADLLIPAVELESLGVAVRQETRLKHLSSLVNLLQKIAKVDPLDQVSIIYRTPLDAEMTAELNAMRSSVDLSVLLPAWREFLIAHCQEEFQSNVAPLKDSLAWVEANAEGDYFKDIPWFDKFFPSSVELKYALAAYRLIAEGSETL